MVWYVNHSNSEIILAVGRIKKSSKMNLLLLTISYYDYVLKKIWYWNFTIVLFQWKKIHILGVVYFFPNKLNIMTCSLVLIYFVTTNIWIFDHPTLLFLRLHHWNWGELHIKGTARGTSRHHTRHFPLLDKLSPVLYTTLATTTTSASTTRQLLPTTSSSSSFSSEHYVLCMYYYYFWLDF